MLRIHLILVLIFSAVTAFSQPLKVACVGTGITHGESIRNPQKSSYPSQLSGFLGDGYVVENFGVAGATVMQPCTLPYIGTKEYNASLNFNPDIVLIEFGANDAKLSNRKLLHEHFKSDYQELINSYKALPSKPRIILLHPTRCYVSESEYFGINDSFMNEIIPSIHALAYANSLEMIDLFNVFGEKLAPYQMSDKLHPSALGATMLVERIVPVITSQSDDFSIPIPSKSKYNFYGYKCYDMGSVRIAEPNRVAVGRPCALFVRRSDPTLDVALLERGIYVVHCDEVASDNVRKFLDGIGLNSQSEIVSAKSSTVDILKTVGMWQNPSVKPVRGSEFRSSVGWAEGHDWNDVSDEISEILTSKKVDLLLIGNSITQGFGGNRSLVTHKPGKQAMDSVSGSWESAGVAGDYTQHVLWRLKNGGYAACDPRVVVVTVGINNLYSAVGVEDVAEGIVAVLEETARQFPNAKIHTFGLFPVKLEPTDANRIKCNQVHEILSRSTMPEGVTYENITQNFLNPDGTLRTEFYGSDHIHLSTGGYEMLSKVIARLL